MSIKTLISIVIISAILIVCNKRSYKKSRKRMAFIDKVLRKIYITLIYIINILLIIEYIKVGGK